MLCEQCNERDATVHLTQVVEGAVKKLHLCEQCAAESGFDLQGPVSITDILLGMGGGAEPSVPGVERSCPKCHLRRTDFKKVGRLGCPACYDAFKDELLPLLKAVHRSDRHAGKAPARGGAGLQASTEFADLQKALDEAVAREQYEEAARLRDKLQACRDRADPADARERKRNP